MKLKNGQVILNKTEIERLHMFWNADDTHSICKSMNCNNIKDLHCHACPLQAINEAMCLVSRLAHYEIQRQEELAERMQAEEDGQIKMKV